MSEPLNELPGYISSFAAHVNGNYVTAEVNEAIAEANTAYQLLNSAAKLQQTIPELQSEKLRSMTVTFQDRYYTYTMTGNKVYGVTRSTST